MRALQSNFTTHKCVRYQDIFLTEAKFAANKYHLCQRKCFKHWFSPEANTRTLPNYEQQQEKEKNLLLALIALKALNVLIMSAEKLSSPRGDLELLCGRLAPSKEEAQVSSQTLWTSKFLCRQPRLSPDRGEQNGREKSVAIFAPGAEKKWPLFTKYFQSGKWSPGLGKDSGRLLTFWPNRLIFFIPKGPPLQSQLS